MLSKGNQTERLHITYHLHERSRISQNDSAHPLYLEGGAKESEIPSHPQLCIDLETSIGYNILSQKELKGS